MYNNRPPASMVFPEFVWPASGVADIQIPMQRELDKRDQQVRRAPAAAT
jgi:hypothetical protein